MTMSRARREKRLSRRLYSLAFTFRNPLYYKYRMVYRKWCILELIIHQLFLLAVLSGLQRGTFSFKVVYGRVKGFTLMQSLPVQTIYCRVLPPPPPRGTTERTDWLRDLLWVCQGCPSYLVCEHLFYPLLVKGISTKNWSAIKTRMSDYIPTHEP